MKLLSWNINGLRACIKNGFLGTIKDLDKGVHQEWIPWYYKGLGC